MLDGLRKLLGKTEQGLSHALQLPYKGFKGLAESTSGAHPLPPSQTRNPATDPFYPKMTPPIPRYPQLLPMIGEKTLPSVQLPSLTLISQSYGGLQPSSSNYEDEVTPQQTLQPTGFTNQTSLNAQLTQGPLSNLYKLRRL